VNAVLFFVALIVLPPLLRVFIRSPRLGVLLVIASAPLEKLSLYAGLTWKPFLWLTPPLAMALLWRWWKKQDPAPRFGRFEGVLLAILLCSLASLATAEAPVRTVRMTVQFLLLFVVAWSMVQTLRRHEDIERALWVLGFSGLAVMLYALLQFMGWVAGIDEAHLLLSLMPRNPTIPESFTVPGVVVLPGGSSLVRLSSTFFDWNIFAGFLVLVLSLSLSHLGWRAHTGRPLGWAFLYSALGLFLLVFTFSRSGWMGLCAALLVLAAGWALRRRAWKLRLALSTGVLLFLIAVGTSLGPFGAIHSRVAILFSGDLSARQHSLYAEAALEMFRRCPALGVGLHNYGEYYTRHFDPQDFGSTAHSAFLSFFAETGLLGATANLALILLVFSMLWAVVRRRRLEEPAYGWAVGLGAAYAGLLTSSLFYLFYNQVYLWVLVGLIAALHRVCEGGRSKVREDETQPETQR